MMNNMYSKKWAWAQTLAIFSSCLVLTLNLIPEATADDGNVIHNISAKLDCGTHAQEQIMGSVQATASLFANMRNAEGSIRFESSKIFSKYLSLAKTAPPPPSLCPEPCKPSSSPLVIFSSSPNKTLDNYDEVEECSKFLVNTQNNPLIYPNRIFNSTDELSQWFNDFSQGKGVDGEDLYEKCPGLCTPALTAKISIAGSSYKVDTSVICGHARDRDDNSFVLKYGFKWSCQGKGLQGQAS